MWDVVETNLRTNHYNHLGDGAGGRGENREAGGYQQLDYHLYPEAVNSKATEAEHIYTDSR